VTNPDPSGATLCASFNQGYQLASPGDRVELEAGSYPAQDLAGKSGAAAPNVLLEAAAGAQVTIDDLVTEGSYVTLRGFTVATGANHKLGWGDSGSYVTLDAVDVTGPYARVTVGSNSSHVTWQNSGFGTPGNTMPRLCDIGTGGGGDPEPVELYPTDYLTFSNLDFYPFLPSINDPACVPDNNMHLEDIRVNNDVNHFRLERSRFHRGDGSNTARLFVTRLSGGNSNDLVVVNNWFGTADGPGGGSYSILLGGNQSCVNYVFAYNHIEQGFDVACNPVASLELVGNTGFMPSNQCMGTQNIRDLWTWPGPGNCGTDQWITDSFYSLAALKYGADGYHLLSDSPAIDAGDTAECQLWTGGVDIDGNPRTGVCDAGPDEYTP
jgi:hypothetical protein